MNLTFIGPSGVGKGTHANRLEQEFKLLHLSTGDLLRENLQARTDLGSRARGYMDRGELVPDELVDAMIEERLRRADSSQGVLFDGFPSTLYQAKFLDHFFEGVGRKLDAAIYFKVSDAEVISRLSGRLICQKCQTPYHARFKPPRMAGACDVCDGKLYQREDDTPEMVRLRLRAFQRAMGPVVDYYHKAGRLLILNGEGQVEDVYRQVVQAVTAVQQRGTWMPTGEEVHLLTEGKAPIVLPTKRAARRTLDLVLLGGPGCGKGTQAEQLSRELKLPHVATGDLFRDNLKQQTPLGKLAKSYMDRGELVPDDITEAMVRDRLARPDAAEGFILDGFPRTLPQAQALAELMHEMQRQLAGVLYINVSDEDIVGRLSARLICRNCQASYHLQFKPPAKPGICDSCGGELYQRDDDNPTTVRARLKTFHAQTEPLIEYYQKAGLISEVSGHGDVSTVTARTQAAAKAIAKSRRKG